MIERFYDPLSGAIYLNGVEIRDLDYNDLHRYEPARLTTPDHCPSTHSHTADVCSHIGLVSQDPTLFAGSIAEMIRMSAQERLHGGDPTGGQVLPLLPSRGATTELTGLVGHDWRVVPTQDYQCSRVH